jgi:sulfite reductase beta subunit-like hemoprotein
MSTEYEHPTALGPTRLGFAREEDVDLFVDTLGRYERGEIDVEEWRAFRLLNGVHGQRPEDARMIRVKIPHGVLAVKQLSALADVAERFAGGKGHITTRQNIQFHLVNPADSEEVLTLLAGTGLTTNEAGANPVRDITQDPFAGVLPGEAFDTSPYAEALTQHLLRGPFPSTLPRALTISFGGTVRADTVGGAFHDLAFDAVLGEQGERGFRVRVGGRLASPRRNAFLAHDFLPAESLNACADAVVRVFLRTGVIDRLGPAGFLKEYEAELALVAAEGGRSLQLPPPRPPLREKNAASSAIASFSAEKFFHKNILLQKQPGFVAVTVKVVLGDLTAAQLRGVAEIAGRFSGEEEVRLAADQNLVIRYVREQDVAAVHHALEKLDLADAGPLTVLDVTSCPGAMSCRLAVTASRGLASHLQAHLAARPDVAARAERLSIKVSGCPNGCGEHHVAGLGWQGAVMKVGGRAAPLYQLSVGGEVHADRATFGRFAAKVPARRVGAVTEKLIALYDAEKEPDEAPNAFFARVAIERVQAVLAGMLDLDETNATEDDFTDLLETQAFVAEPSDDERAA